MSNGEPFYVGYVSDCSESQITEQENANDITDRAVVELRYVLKRHFARKKRKYGSPSFGGS